ncbi:NAD(P)-binding protein [Mycena maculata]|uniref:NAD(P)-binding protein n=1 Tax=Mycena maculata TaxID=230809 RepID=A0AAD7I3R5_9AGAR|nr:NAD(P)-binding protein [Mycena maculata]
MPIITVFGATGYQGSSVVEAVLVDRRFTPRAVSRSVESAASKALIARGVEVVVANFFNAESLRNAMQGSEAVFGMTNSWDPDVLAVGPRGEGEVIQGRNLVDAAKAVGVKFFIWSSYPSATKESKGLYPNLFHLDNKASIEDYLRASGLGHAMLLTSWFAENLWKIGALKKTDTGYDIPIPKFTPKDTQAVTWVAHDLGRAAVALLTNYTDPMKGVLGNSYPVITMRLTYPELAAAIAKAIGKEVTFTPLETAPTAHGNELFLFLTEIGLYRDTPTPNPDLIALGVQFGSLEEFIHTEVVPRFA